MKQPNSALLQSYILLILNLSRSNNYDILPSKSYQYCKEGKNEDFTYQQQVELKSLLRSSTGKTTLSFLMLSDCVYDYGDEETSDSIRSLFITEISIMSFLKALLKLDIRLTMIITHYISELALWLVTPIEISFDSKVSRA